MWTKHGGIQPRSANYTEENRIDGQVGGSYGTMRVDAESMQLELKCWIICRGTITAFDMIFHWTFESKISRRLFLCSLLLRSLWGG
jgi:hypothetical protein